MLFGNRCTTANSYSCVSFIEELVLDSPILISHHTDVKVIDFTRIVADSRTANYPNNLPTPSSSTATCRYVLVMLIYACPAASRTRVRPPARGQSETSSGACGGEHGRPAPGRPPPLAAPRRIRRCGREESVRTSASVRLVIWGAKMPSLLYASSANVKNTIDD
jgi:hypothetical protein